MERALKLTLSSPIYLESTEASLDSLISGSEKKMIGYEAVVLYSISCENESMTLSRIEGGERNGYTEEEKRRIESGMKLERKAEEDFMIPVGTYLFQQLPYLPSENELPRIILPYVRESNLHAYVRIYKENVLETVMQLLFPIE